MNDGVQGEILVMNTHLSCTCVLDSLELSGMQLHYCYDKHR